MAWRLTRTGGTINLNRSFNLREYVRTTSFTQNDTEAGTFVDSESIRAPAHRMILTGIIKGADAADSESKLSDIETVATSDATDLVLRNTNTSEDFSVQHVETRALRQGGGIMQVTLTFLTLLLELRTGLKTNSLFDF